MTAELPQIVSDDRRHGERRADRHTPETCFKLLDVQEPMNRIFARLKEGDARMDSIFGELAEGRARMDGIEKKLGVNHLAATDGLNRLASIQEESRQDMSRVLEIVSMGEGFFKAIKFTGKWLRKAIMWVVPPIAAVIGLWQMIFNKGH